MNRCQIRLRIEHNEYLLWTGRTRAVCIEPAAIAATAAGEFAGGRQRERRAADERGRHAGHAAESGFVLPFRRRTGAHDSFVMPARRGGEAPGSFIPARAVAGKR